MDHTIAMNDVNVGIERCDDGIEVGPAVRVYNYSPRNIMLQVRNCRRNKDGSSGEYMIAGAWLSVEQAKDLAEAILQAVKE